MFRCDGYTFAVGLVVKRGGGGFGLVFDFLFGWLLRFG